MNIFITGISGFVGSGLVEYFGKDDSITITGHGRDVAGIKEKFRQHHVTVVPSWSAQVFNDLKIDCVIHLAGIAHDLSNKYKPEDYYRVNEDGTKSIFNEFVQSEASKFIFVSSIKACVDTTSEPVDEQIAPQPFSDYGKSKLAAEKYILTASVPTGKSVYVFRPCMIHGKGNKGNLNLLYRYVKTGLPYIFGAYHNRRSFLSAENFHFITSKFIKNSFPSGIYHLADQGSMSTTELIMLIAGSQNRKTRIWNVSASLLDASLKAGTFIGLPFERMKQKLTESLVVSTDKLSGVLNEPLPLDIRSGLQITLKSFDE